MWPEGRTASLSLYSIAGTEQGKTAFQSQPHIPCSLPFVIMNSLPFCTATRVSLLFGTQFLGSGTFSWCFSHTCEHSSRTLRAQPSPSQPAAFSSGLRAQQPWAPQCLSNTTSLSHSVTYSQSPPCIFTLMQNHRRFHTACTTRFPLSAAHKLMVPVN